MRVSSIILGAGAIAVAAGGLYLWLSLESGAAAPTPEQALAAAQAETSRGDQRAADRARGDRAGSNKARPGLPQRRDRDAYATSDPEAAARTNVPAPLVDYRKGGDAVPAIDLPAKFRADVTDPREVEGLSPDQTDHLVEANKLYDRGDFDGARSLAKKMLSQLPGNVRMLRVVVSSACIMGDNEEAQKYASELPPSDHEAMVARCAKYEIALKPRS